jgi:hypothetical protein
MRKRIVAVKYTFTFIALCLLLTACGRRDAKLSHDITGVWLPASGVSEQFNPNGSFLATTGDSGGTTNVLAGTWAVKNGFLTEVITNVSGPNPHARIGDTARLKIISADAHHMTIEVGGQTRTISR